MNLRRLTVRFSEEQPGVLVVSVPPPVSLGAMILVAALLPEGAVVMFSDFDFDGTWLAAFLIP
jgi:hypothetical protein